MQFNAAVNDKRCNDAKHPYFEPKAVLERQRQIVIILGEVSPGLCAVIDSDNRGSTEIHVAFEYNLTVNVISVA